MDASNFLHEKPPGTATVSTNNREAHFGLKISA